MEEFTGNEAPSIESGFLDKLRNVSPRLYTKWERGLDRWVIWYKGKDGQDYRIWEVKNEDGSYRPLDDRTIELMQRADMSKQVGDPAYIASEQYRKRKQYIEEAKEQSRLEAKYRGRQLGNKRWVDAIDNAARGITKDSQLRQKKIFSIPSTSVTLLKKLGRPSNFSRAVKL